MAKLKKLFINVRMIVLLVTLLLAVVAIYPNFAAEGVAIRSVTRDSAAAMAGFESPKPTTSPMSRERIISMNNVPIADIEDYYKFISTLEPNRTVQIRTNKELYKLTTRMQYRINVLPELEEVTTEEVVQVNRTINGTVMLVNETVEKRSMENRTEKIPIGLEDIGLSVYNAPKTNVKKGLDLQGGTRVLLKPETKVSQEDMDTILENIKERLNVFGLSDVIVRAATDLSGDKYVLIEIAGANEEEVRELVAKQGKFEAKISNQTVFFGGNDVTYVCRSADCSGIDPMSGCSPMSGGEGWGCRFRFVISLSPEAAQRQADLTDTLDVVVGEGDNDYLSEKLMLYLDDALVDELNIGSDLKGKAVTDIQISGSGVGSTQQEAIFDSLQNMKRLQTILITGSLPVKLEVEKIDAISPVLGESFVKNSVFVALLAMLAVALVIFVRYRSLKVSVPMLLTMLSEVIILLGIAALIRWNIDLAAIAGIIVSVGTGVDDQIVITDETMKKGGAALNWRQRIKNAFFIIMGAYFTTVVAMVPLLFAGAGLIKGFALTTIIGVSIGVFVTRPAYAKVIEVLLK